MIIPQRQNTKRSLGAFAKITLLIFVFLFSASAYAIVLNAPSTSANGTYTVGFSGNTKYFVYIEYNPGNYWRTKSTFTGTQSSGSFIENGRPNGTLYYRLKYCDRSSSGTANNCAYSTVKGVTTTSNAPPTISAMYDVIIPVNSSITIPFTVTDDWAPSRLSVVAVESGPPSVFFRFEQRLAFSISGSGSNRALKITPAANDEGSMQITIVVREPSGGQANSVNFKFTAGYAGTITFSWTGGGHYSIVEELQDDGTWIQVGGSDKNGGSASLTRPNGTYTFRLSTCTVTGSQGGNDTHSCSIRWTKTYVVDVPPPVTPINLNLPISDDDGLYSFTWSAVPTPGTITYTVEEVKADGTVKITPDISETYFPVTVIFSDTYKYRVKACGGGGCSDYSSYKTIDVAIKPKNTPSYRIFPSIHTSSSLIVRWDSPTGHNMVTHYKLNKRIVGTGTWIPVLPNERVVQRNVTGLTVGDWQFQVQGCNTVRTFTSCSEFLTSPTLKVRPSVPGNFKIIDLSSNNSASMALDWDASSFATSYLVEQNIDGVTTTISTTDTSLPIGALLNDFYHYYSFRVKGCVGNICGDYSRRLNKVDEENGFGMSSIDVYIGDGINYRGQDALFIMNSAGQSFEIPLSSTMVSIDISDSYISISNTLEGHSYSKLEPNVDYFSGDFFGNDSDSLIILTDSLGWFFSGIVKFESNNAYLHRRYLTSLSKLLEYDLLIGDFDQDGDDDIKVYKDGKLISKHLSEDGPFPSRRYFTPSESCISALLRKPNCIAPTQFVGYALSCLEDVTNDVQQYCIDGNAEKIAYEDKVLGTTDTLTKKYGALTEIRDEIINKNNAFSQAISDNQMFVDLLKAWGEEFGVEASNIKTNLSASLQQYESDLSDLAGRANSASDSVTLQIVLNDLDTVYRAQSKLINERKSALLNLANTYNSESGATYLNYLERLPFLLVDLIDQGDGYENQGRIVDKMMKYIVQREKLVSQKTEVQRQNIEERLKAIYNAETGQSQAEEVQLETYARKADQFLTEVDQIWNNTEAIRVSSFNGLRYQTDRFKRINKIERLAKFCESIQIESWQQQGCDRVLELKALVQNQEVGSISDEINSGLALIANLGANAPSTDLQVLVQTSLADDQIKLAAIFYDQLLIEVEQMTNSVGE